MGIRRWIARLRDGLLNGPIREVRCPNGMMGRGRFYHGLGDKDGLWTFYYEDGQTWCEGEFSIDFEIGTWTFYHPNGKACARGVDGWRRQGTWEFWDEAGHPVDEASFLARNPAVASRLPRRDNEPTGDVSRPAERGAAADRPPE